MDISFEMNRFVFALNSDVGFTRAWKQEFLSKKLSVRNNVSSFMIGYKF